MTDPTTVEKATKRLTLALDSLDAAVERRLDSDRGRVALTAHVHALDADRAKLAADLDGRVAKVRRLETANRYIARRLEAAMENVRQVLDSQN